MKLLKKSQPQKEAAPVAVSLKAQLKQAVDAAEKYIATIAQREKDASPLQPLTWHELNLRLQYGSRLG